MDIAIVFYTVAKPEPIVLLILPILAVHVYSTNQKGLTNCVANTS